jgi:hypothetical protein
MSSKLQYLTNLEINNPKDIIVDMEDNILLPNLHQVEQSSSLFLPEDIFSNYLDKILFESSKYYNNKICNINSIFYTDYFITIDFTDLLYKIPSVFINTLETCKLDSNIRYYIIPLRIEFTYKSAHSNLIIIDKYYKTIEFFEPHGTSFIGQQPYNIEEHIKNLLIQLFPLQTQYYRYINVHSNCPIGLQSLQNIISSKSGHCLAWSLLFINIRLLNIFLHPQNIIQYFNKHFKITELDIYIKRYISLLELSQVLIPAKTIPKFKYKLTLSNTEKNNITNEIISLSNQYLTELNNNKNKNVLDKLFEKLMSYHKFPDFSNIFFNVITSNNIKRKLSIPSNENSKKLKPSTYEIFNSDSKFKDISKSNKNSESSESSESSEPESDESESQST